MADFRPCPICLSNSQAVFKAIKLKTLKKLFTTIARLRYYLGGHRPSETTNHTIFLKKLVQDI